MGAVDSVLRRQNGAKAYLELHRSIDLELRLSGEKRMLIEMLLDGLAASLCAMKACQRGVRLHNLDFNDHRERSERIIAGLGLALDGTAAPELTDLLGSLYRYWLQQLGRLELAQDQEAQLDELIKMVGEIRKAWAWKG